MALNEIDDVYGTQEQVEFARRMAESLLKGAGTGMPDASMAVLPGTWAYGAGNVLRALAGNQYRGIAGSQDKALSDRMLDPNAPNTAKNLRNSQIRNQTRPTPPPRHDYSGGNPDATGAANANADVTPTSGSDFINKVRMIESGGRPDAVTGSYRGHFQFGKAEEKRYGINDTNWKDPRVAEAAFKKHMAWLYPQLEKKLGRAPTPGELYLAHQQGVAGGPALLTNPDKPAWEAIRPYYDSDYMAKLAVSGNIPKSSPLKKIPVEQVMAGDFARQWTSRFDGAAPSGPKIAGQPELPGRMNLGGPKPEGELQPTNQPLGDQLAQAPAFPSRPAGVPANATPNQPGISGYQGPVPPANPLETDAQLQARLRAAPAAQRQQILEDYLKRKEGRVHTTPGGGSLIVTPEAGAEPQVTHIPGKDIPLGIGNLNLNMRQKPDGTLELLLPGGQTKGFNTISDMLEFVRKEQAADTASTGLTTKATENVTRAIEEGEAAIRANQLLSEMEVESKSSNWTPRGPTAGFMLKARQFLDNFGLSTKGTTNAEILEKLNGFLASKATQAISARGTNFELQTFMRTNPGLMQTKEGTELLIDILKQESKQQQDIRKIAQRVKSKDVNSFASRVDEYYHNNPIIMNIKGKKVTTRKIGNDEESKEYVDSLPSGHGFIAPDGSIRYKP